MDIPAEKELQVEVVDLCITSTLTIDDSVFKTPPTTSLTQFVAYSELQLSWTDAIVSSDLSNPGICGPMVHEISDVSTASHVPVTAGDPFWTNDLSLTSKVLFAQTNDELKVASYTLEISIFFEMYAFDLASFPPFQPAKKQFLIVIVRFCMPSSISALQNFVPDSITYEVGDGQSYSSDFSTAVTTVPVVCSLHFKLSVTPPIMDPSMITFSPASAPRDSGIMQVTTSLN